MKDKKKKTKKNTKSIAHIQKEKEEKTRKQKKHKRDKQNQIRCTRILRHKAKKRLSKQLDWNLFEHFHYLFFFHVMIMLYPFYLLLAALAWQLYTYPWLVTAFRHLTRVMSGTYIIEIMLN